MSVVRSAAADWLDEEETELADADVAPLEAAVRTILARLGEDPAREGLQRTPSRVAKSLQFLTSGYELEPEDVVNGALFAEESSELVLVRDIELYSLCEHHLLPFHGRAHVAYVPDGRVIGLSKLPRIVDVYARRLQVQERLTEQVASAVERVLRPLGVAVVVEATHMCMSMRGVQKHGGRTITSAMRGCFRDDARTRGELMSLLRERYAEV